MKRYLLILFLTIMTPFVSSYAASPILTNPNNRHYWGARFDIDLNIPSPYRTPIGDFDYANGGGIGFGVIYNQPIIANLYFEPGVSFYYDTYKADELSNADASGYITTERPKVTKTGFRIPINVGYHFDIWKNASLSFFTGPEFNIGLYAKVKSDILNDADIDTNLYNDSHVLGGEGSWHRFTASWLIGVSVAVNRIDFKLTGVIGMSDLVESDKISFHENALRFSVGYNF